MKNKNSKKKNKSENSNLIKKDMEKSNFNSKLENNTLNKSIESIKNTDDKTLNDLIEQFDKSEETMSALHKTVIEWRNALYFPEINPQYNKTAIALMYFIKKDNMERIDYNKEKIATAISIIDLERDDNISELQVKINSHEDKEMLALLGIKEGIAGYDEVATKKIKMIKLMTKIKIAKINELEQCSEKKNLNHDHVRGKIKDNNVDTKDGESESMEAQDLKLCADYGLFFHLFISLECSLLMKVCIDEAKIKALNTTLYEGFNTDTTILEGEELQFFTLDILKGEELQFFTYFNMKLYNKFADYMKSDEIENFLNYPNQEYTLIMIDRLSRATNNETRTQNNDKLRGEINKLREATKGDDDNYHLTIKIFSLALIEQSLASKPLELESFYNFSILWNDKNKFIQSIFKGQKKETVESSINILKAKIDPERNLGDILDTILSTILKNYLENTNVLEEKIEDVVPNNLKNFVDDVKRVPEKIQENGQNLLDIILHPNEDTNQNNNSANEDTNENDNSANENNLLTQNNQNLEEKSMGNTPLIIGSVVTVSGILSFVAYYISSSTQKLNEYHELSDLPSMNVEE